MSESTSKVTCFRAARCGLLCTRDIPSINRFSSGESNAVVENALSMWWAFNRLIADFSDVFDLFSAFAAA